MNNDDTATNSQQESSSHQSLTLYFFRSSGYSMIAQRLVATVCKFSLVILTKLSENNKYVFLKKFISFFTFLTLPTSLTNDFC